MKMNDHLDKLLADNQSGSYTLTRNVFATYREYITNFDSDLTVEDMFDDIHHMSRVLIKHQPNMVLLRRTTNSLISFFKRLLKGEHGREEIKQSLIEKISQIEQDLNENLNNIAVSGSKIIANFNKVMTISNSTAVSEIINAAHEFKRKFEVFCLRSDPPGEGAAFAERLAARGIKTTLLADSQAGLIINDMNLVVLGADRLYESGFVNKSGTLQLVLLANHFNVPVYLAAETTKILKETERSIKLIERDPGEVHEEKEGLQVINQYYETIPIELIHKVICEEGVYEREEFVNWYLKG